MYCRTVFFQPCCTEPRWCLRSFNRGIPLVGADAVLASNIIAFLSHVNTSLLPSRRPPSPCAGHHGSLFCRGGMDGGVRLLGGRAGCHGKWDSPAVQELPRSSGGLCAVAAESACCHCCSLCCGYCCACGDILPAAHFPATDSQR